MHNRGRGRFDYVGKNLVVAQAFSIYKANHPLECAEAKGLFNRRDEAYSKAPQEPRREREVHRLRTRRGAFKVVENIIKSVNETDEAVLCCRALLR